MVDHAGVTVGWPERLVVRPLSGADAEEVAEWRYRGRWRIYDMPAEDGLLTAEDGYRSVVGRPEGPLVGFCCAGEEARVPGLAGHPGVLDVGFGMHPHWVGRGHGPAFGRAVFEYLRAEHPGAALRAVVQSWNERSLRLLLRLGMVETGRHVCVQDGAPVEYLVLAERVWVRGFGCCGSRSANRNSDQVIVG